LLFSGTIFAQAVKTDSIPDQAIGEVVITANRYGTIVTKTPEAIRVLGNNAIEKYQVRTTAEALLLSPGVFVQKTNHGGGSPFLRGLTGNQTLLLIDGIRLSNSTFRYGPNQYLNTIDVFSLDNMEVLRGSGSVQYGSDAIGGTIQAFSHAVRNSETPEWGGSLLSRVATQGMEQSMSGAVNYSDMTVAIRGGITIRNFGDIVGGDTTGRQTPSGYREFDVDLKGKIKLSASSELTAAYQNVLQKDVPVYHKIELENYAINRMHPQKRDLAYLRLNQVLDGGIFKSLVVTASYHNFKETRELLKNGSSVIRTENDRVRSLGFSAELNTFSGDHHTATTGIEIYSDFVNSSRNDFDTTTDISEQKRGLYPDGSTMSSLAAFSLHTIDFKSWNITAGLRFNSFIIKVADETLNTTKLTSSALVGNLGIMRKLNANSNLFVSLNTGFRAPNIDDLGTLGIVDFRYEIPNLDLEPEQSFQYQVGYKQKYSRLSGELFLYRNELYNLIVRNKVPDEIIDGYPVYIKENTERAYIEGIETAWDFELNKSWLISAGMTYTYGQNITKDEPVRRIPPLFGRMATEFRTGNLWLNLEWQAAGSQERLATGDKDDNRIPSGGTPGWNIFNISSAYTIGVFKIDLSLVNIFNTDYRYHGSGVNGYGRSAFLTLIVSL
jgi:outer membrane receptor protein involved in Fe transport